MRVIGLDVHRSMAVVAILENGHLSSCGRVELTRDAVIAFGRKLRCDDEVVIEATQHGNDCPPVAPICGDCQNSRVCGATFHSSGLRFREALIEENRELCLCDGPL